MIQKLIEVEEDRIVEEVQVQRRRLSHMQQEERKNKAIVLQLISQQLRRALEMEEVLFNLIFILLSLYFMLFLFDKSIVFMNRFYDF